MNEKKFNSLNCNPAAPRSDKGQSTVVYTVMWIIQTCVNTTTASCICTETWSEVTPLTAWKLLNQQTSSEKQQLQPKPCFMLRWVSVSHTTGRGGEGDAAWHKWQRQWLDNTRDFCECWNSASFSVCHSFCTKEKMWHSCSLSSSPNIQRCALNVPKTYNLNKAKHGQRCCNIKN